MGLTSGSGGGGASGAARADATAVDIGLGVGRRAKGICEPRALPVNEVNQYYNRLSRSF